MQVFHGDSEDSDHLIPRHSLPASRSFQGDFQNGPDSVFREAMISRWKTRLAIFVETRMGYGAADSLTYAVREFLTNSRRGVSVMRRVLFLMLAVLVAAVPAQGDEKWVSLFDGKTLNGWKKAAHGKATYEVVDGAIHGVTVEGSPNSFLMSEQEYGDFELEFEVRVHDQLNSGCQIRSREKNEADVQAEAKRTGTKPQGDGGLGRFHGPQVEIEKAPGFAGYIYGESTQYGWLSPEPKSGGKPHSLMKNGDWNKFRIVAKGPHIETYINGTKVGDLNHSEIYETHAKGHIGLQVHGIAAGTGPFDVSWRSIRIREL